ncbi:MAG: histidine--tRNA ligase [Acidobacteriota bacterium]
MSRQYRVLRGMHDILPEEVGRWQFLEATTRERFARYGFREIRTPLLETTDLFAHSVGASSDIVRKEMYTITRGDASISLRPENTAPVVRAFVEHSRHRGIAAGYPERLFYIGPMFRYERPQKGRQRQFHQIGVEILGGEESLIEAETIEMVWGLLKRLRIESIELQLGTVGDVTCRPKYREALREWLLSRVADMCEDCRRRADENPLRVFDCKVETDRQMLTDAPTMGDFLCAPCGAHFSSVKRHLDTLGVPYVEDARLVRGLDYYRRTVFEITAAGLGAQNAILGGGRYDGLVRELGGHDVPGFGFAMGMERTVMLIPDEILPASTIDVSLIALGTEGHRAAIGLAQRLRGQGVSVQIPMSDRPMGAQLKRADRAGARFALFVGQDELKSGHYGLKDLRSGKQEQLDEAGLVARLRTKKHGGA